MDAYQIPHYIILLASMKLATLLMILSALCILSQAMDIESARRFLQSSVRTATVAKMCAKYPNRNDLVDEKAKADAEANNAAMKSSMGVSGNQLLGRILKASDLGSGAAAQLPNIQVPLGLFVGPFVLGLLIMYVMCPYLCCCCCCPGCCPSKCCQKPDNEQYTKCELIWPAVVLILALLLLIVASIIGISRASDIETSYSTVGCSLAITFDDVLYGNLSSTNKYFIGMKNLANSLGDLKTNINGVELQLNKLKTSNGSSPLVVAYNAGTSLLNAISSIPTGAVGGTMTAFGYKHFDNTGVANVVPSTFPDILGTANTGSPSGAINSTFYAVNLINEGLKTISDNAGNFTGQIGTVGGTIDQLSGSMNEMADLVLGLDGSISGGTDSITPIMSIVTTGVTAFFGVFIGFGVLGILATLLMTFCDKFSCRYLLYFLCIFLLLLGMLCFILSILFSIITPILYFGCDFLTTSLSSSANFNTNIGFKFPQLGSYLSVCLPGSSGDLINQLGGVDLSAINNLTSVVNSINTFQASTLQTGVETALNTLDSLIDKYYYTDQFDFNSPNDLTLMRNVATPSNYPSCASTNSFSQDSWVPSLRQSSISCAVSGTATDTNCPTSTEIQAGRGGPGTCYGCMDSMKVLLNSGTAQITDITNRYTGCTGWITAMSNLWTAYYLEKKNNYPAVRTNMAAAKTNYNAGSSGYHDQLDSVQSAFVPISTQLTSIVRTVVDPQYGMVAGLNCLLLGEDLLMVSNTTCVRLFNTFYFLRFALGLAAFAILFTMCCTTCSGVRAFKHSERRGSIVPKDNIPGEQSTIAALNQKY